MFELICMFFFVFFVPSLLFDQFMSNIQEIIDIEWLFELICMLHYKLSGKEEITVKQEKVVNYYYITVP